MKKITFIRHYKLEEPYDKRETISPLQYIQLSKGELDPTINSDIREYILNNLKIEEFSNFDIILTSPLRRTKDSARSIINTFNLQVTSSETPLLTECIWNPEFTGSRIQRFIDGNELSNLQDTWQRIFELNIYLQSLDYANILCVTHSFFIQILYLYYSGNSFKDWRWVTEADIKGSYHAEYLKGFSVNI